VYHNKMKNKTYHTIWTV